MGFGRIEMTGRSSHKRGEGAWSAFDKGLDEYKEDMLKRDWWYSVMESKPYTSRRSRRLLKRQQERDRRAAAHAERLEIDAKRMKRLRGGKGELPLEVPEKPVLTDLIIPKKKKAEPKPAKPKEPEKP